MSASRQLQINMAASASLVFVLVVASVSGYGYRKCDSKDKPGFGFPEPLANVSGGANTISPSGLAMSRKLRGILYFINDDGSSGDTKIYAFSVDTKTVIGTIDIDGATNNDWEAIATGPCDGGHKDCIYVHDSGDSFGAPAKTIYVVEEVDDPSLNLTVSTLKVIMYSFEDGSDSASDTLFVDCDENIMFFDLSQTGAARLYKVEQIPAHYSAVPIQEVTFHSVGLRGPLAASLSPDCCELLVKFEDKTYLVPYEDHKLIKSKLKLLPTDPSPKCNAIAWSSSQRGYFTASETDPSVIKFAPRGENVPRTSYSFGMVIGKVVEPIAKITGLAASRRHNGVSYMVSGASTDIMIVQTFEAQNVGKVSTNFINNFWTDVAVSVCPSEINATYCVYVLDGVNESGLTRRIYVFAEVDDPYVETAVSVSDDTTHTIIFEFPLSEWLDALMVDCEGNVYLTDGDVGFNQPINVYKVVDSPVSSSSLITIATFNSPSVEPGPVAADISPCCDEILLKYEDNVYRYDLKNNDVAMAFQTEPELQPYIPGPKGTSVGYTSDCNCYLTTEQLSSSRERLPVKKYTKLCNKKLKYY